MGYNHLIKYVLLSVLLTLVYVEVSSQNVRIVYQDNHDTLFSNGIFSVSIGGPAQSWLPGSAPRYSKGVWHFESKQDSLIRLNSFYEYKTVILNTLEYVDTSISGYCLELYSKDGTFVGFIKEESGKKFFTYPQDGTLELQSCPLGPLYKVKNIHANHFVMVIQFAKDYPNEYYIDNKLIRLTSAGIDWYPENNDTYNESNE